MNLGKMKTFALSHNSKFPCLKAYPRAAAASRIVFVIYILVAETLCALRNYSNVNVEKTDLIKSLYVAELLINALNDTLS